MTWLQNEAIVRWNHCNNTYKNCGIFFIENHHHCHVLLDIRSFNIMRLFLKTLFSVSVTDDRVYFPCEIFFRVYHSLRILRRALTSYKSKTNAESCRVWVWKSRQFIRLVHRGIKGQSKFTWNKNRFRELFLTAINFRLRCTTIIIIFDSVSTERKYTRNKSLIYTNV